MSTFFKSSKRVRVAVSVGIAWIMGLPIGCQTGDLRNPSGRDCAAIEQAIDLSARIDALNLLSEAFASRCDELVVKYGTQARSRFRHKSFSVTRETANVFVPDGTFIDYAMESYERGYLSALLPASYIRLQNPEEGKVELRDLDHELFAPIYNYGEDPVNLLLSAVLWERVGAGGRVAGVPDRAISRARLGSAIHWCYQWLFFDHAQTAVYGVLRVGDGVASLHGNLV